MSNYDIEKFAGEMVDLPVGVGGFAGETGKSPVKFAGGKVDLPVGVISTVNF